MNLRRNLTRLAGMATAAVLASGAMPAGAATSVVTASAPLSDLSATAHPTDGAHGQLYAVAPGDGNSYVYFILTGLDANAAGTTFGAHVHVGPCVAGNGAAAGPHFNTGTGGPPSLENEVWLDFTVRHGGVAVSRATVPFEIEPGQAQSVVIHANPTQSGTGLAGGRIACLPVAF